MFKFHIVMCVLSGILFISIVYKIVNNIDKHKKHHAFLDTIVAVILIVSVYVNSFSAFKVYLKNKPAANKKVNTITYKLKEGLK